MKQSSASPSSGITYHHYRHTKRGYHHDQCGVCGSNPIYMNFSFLCRFQEHSCQDLKVLVENRGKLTASNCGSQERDEDDTLCEQLNVTLPPRNYTDVLFLLPELLSKYFVIHAVSLLVNQY